MRSIAYDHQIFSLQQYGGISRYFCELSQRVNKAPGYSAKIIAPIHLNSYLAESSTPKTAHYWPLQTRGIGRAYRAVNGLLAPFLARSNAPSLIHGTYYWPVAKVKNTPVILTVYDMTQELFPDMFPAGNRTSQDKRASVERADHILCISECTANDLIHLFGVKREKISVTYLGYSEIFENATTVNDSPPGDRPYLLYVGARMGYKNFEKVLTALSNSSRLRNNIDLIAFGGPQFNADEVAQIERLRLRPGSVVHRSGSDALLAAAYRHAIALVYPSRYEGFGIPPLEAMSAGCPVACSNASSLPEVVGQAARLFDPDDVESISAALEIICFDEVERHRLKVAGLDRSKEFSWDRCTEATVAAYERLLD